MRKFFKSLLSDRLPPIDNPVSPAQQRPPSRDSSSKSESGDHESSPDQTILETCREHEPFLTEQKGTSRRWKQGHQNSRSSAREALDRAMRLTVNAIPPVKSAVESAVSFLHLFEVADSNREGYDQVVSQLSEMSEYLNRHMNDPRSQGLTDRISDIARVVQEETESARKIQEQSKSGQVLRAADREEDLARWFRRIGELFRQIQMEISMSEWSNTYELLVNDRLKELAPVSLARYNSGISDAIGRRACTEDTRLDTLAKIEEWCANPSAPMIYWMDGMAGTGKTTIAYTLAKHLESCHQLGASFFCTVTSEECRRASSIIPTIAHQLSHQSTPFKAALGEVLKHNPDSAKLSIHEQMERLLIGPLQNVENKMARNLVVVIDALDECSDPNIVRLILGSLIKSAGRLPLKFFITSRPEPAIYDHLAPQSDDLRSVLHLHEVRHDSVQNDLRLYLNEGLQSIQPLEDEIEQLTVLSDRLFIYAATAIRYIIPVNVSVDSRARLRTMLETGSKSAKKHSAIDALYTAILSSVIDNDDLEPHERESMLSVMWAVVYSDRPISPVGLAVIAGVNDQEAVLMMVGPLRSVLHVSETTRTVSTFHASFPQFIKDKSRSNAFHCEEARLQETSALRCMKVFKSELPNLPLPDVILSPYFMFAAAHWPSYLLHIKCSAEGFPEEVYTELSGLVEAVARLRGRLRPEPSTVIRRRTGAIKRKSISSRPILLQNLERVGVPADLLNPCLSAIRYSDTIQGVVRNRQQGSTQPAHQEEGGRNGYYY